jgi:outer membrane protein OmpA-like peptidoglycan-associated protein
VRTVFLSCGFAPEIITISAMGESSPLVETEDDIEEPMNRRVEVVVKSRKVK